MFVIGLTGGIGTGKTQVSKLLEDLGADIVNADLLGHEIYKPQTEGWREVVKTFGEKILASNDEVDRKKLGAIVFSDAAAMDQLNGITHPRIYKLAEKRIQGLSEQGGSVAVLEAALLIEARWTPLVNEVWVTTSPEESVIKRLQQRNNLEEDAIRARIASQMPQEKRVTHADVVIDNSTSLEQLEEKIQQLWNSRVLAHIVRR